MNLEQKLLAVSAKSCSAFNELEKYNASEEFSDLGKIIYEAIRHYYSNDANAQNVDLDILKESLVSKHEKHARVFEEQVSILNSDVSSPNVLQLFRELRRTNISNQLASALLSEEHKKAQALIEQYNTVAEPEVNEDVLEVYNDLSLDDVFSVYDPDNAIKLFPQSLNEFIGGGVQRGNHILVFARPEAGKSMVAINMTAGFLAQGLTVLYIGNEDPARAMLARMMSRLSGMNRYECMQDRAAAYNIAVERGYKNLYFKDLAPGTIPELRSLIEDIEPDILVVDQIRNLDMGCDGLVQTLERAAIEMRNFAKKYNMVVVSVTQAGDSATGVLQLTQSDVDSSKTGLPAQIDLMIGVGMNQAYEADNRRMLSLPRNKLNGEHGSLVVRVNPQLSKVDSL